MFKLENISFSTNSGGWAKTPFYEYVYGTLPPGASYVKDSGAYFHAHAKDYLVIRVWGPHPKVPAGYIGVFATVGGGQSPAHYQQGRFFLVPVDDYREHRRFAFVIDPKRHVECLPLTDADPALQFGAGYLAQTNRY